TGRQHCRLGFNVGNFTGFDFNCDNTNHFVFGVLDQINSVPLVQEASAALEVGLVERVQQCVTGTVGSSAGTRSLGRIVRTLGLTTKRTLINTTLLGTGERQPHVLQLKNSLRADRTHVLDSVLITDIVGALDGV